MIRGLAVAGLLLATAVIAGTALPLTGITDSAAGRQLFPGGYVAAGATQSATFTATSTGWIPETPSLRIPSGAGLRVTAWTRDRGHPDYDGPADGRWVNLGTVAWPGQAVTIHVDLHNTSAAIATFDGAHQVRATPAVPRGWAAGVAAAGAIIAVLAIAFGGRRPAGGVAGAVGTAPGRRPAVAVMVVALAVSWLGTGAALAGQSASVGGPGSTFTTGVLDLTATYPAGQACFGLPAGAPCTAVFGAQHLKPGQRSRTSITIREPGGIPALALAMWSNGCRTLDDPTERFHGSGDACSSVLMNVHDDTHGGCVYPVAAAGDCGAAPAGSLADFAGRYSAAAPLGLDPAGLPDGVTFTFDVQLAEAAPNTIQGRVPQVDFVWQMSG